MLHELWDTGNLVGAYASERAALDVVRGMPSVEHIALAREDADRRTRAVAQGSALAARAAGRRPAAE